MVASDILKNKLEYYFFQDTSITNIFKRIRVQKQLYVSSDKTSINKELLKREIRYIIKDIVDNNISPVSSNHPIINTSLKLNKQQLAEFCSMMMLDNIHDFKKSADFIKWIPVYVNMFKNFILQSSRSISQANRNFITNELFNTSFVKSMETYITSTLKLNVKYFSSNGTPAKINDNQPKVIPGDFERKIFLQKSHLFEKKFKDDTKRYSFPLVPQGNKSELFNLDMSNFGGLRMAYSNFTKLITLSNQADAGSFYLHENKFVKMIENIIVENFNDREFFKTHTRQQNSRLTQRKKHRYLNLNNFEALSNKNQLRTLFNIDFNDFKYSIDFVENSVNIELMKVEFVVNNTNQINNLYMLKINDIHYKQAGILSVPASKHLLNTSLLKFFKPESSKKSISKSIINNNNNNNVANKSTAKFESLDSYEDKIKYKFFSSKQNVTTNTSNININSQNVKNTLLSNHNVSNKITGMNYIDRNANISGYVFTIFLRKFLGDFSQIMYCISTNTILGTGDYMCGSMYLWLILSSATLRNNTQSTINSKKKSKLLFEDSTNMQLKYFGRHKSKKNNKYVLNDAFLSK
jgi:hypothetical protein